MDSKETILQTMKKAGQPVSAGQVAEMSGLDRKEVDKVMKTLQKEDRIISPKRCFWEPK